MIETPRVKLIKVSKLNSKRFQEIDFSGDLMRYITSRPLSTEEAVERYSFNMDHKHFGAYFVEGAGSDQIIGFAVIKEKGKEAEIGYMVLDAFRGKGIATEINTLLIELCRTNLPAFSISAYVDQRNKASIRVLEKSGMKKYDIESDDGITSLKFTL